MKIKKMTARFGRLDNEELELHDGLNIVYAPNESGKSTWCAFIRAMLYSVDSSQREKAGVKPDKVRFAPWSGGVMAGEMEIEHEGKLITLSRSTKTASAPMREFSAVYTATAQRVAELTGADAGQALTGLPRAVFEASVFVRQAGLGVQSGAELEKRIGAIVTTGEEGASYTDTDERLRAWLRRRKHNKTGAIPVCEGELAALEARRSEMQELYAERTEAAERLSALIKEQDTLRAEEEGLRALMVKGEAAALREELQALGAAAGAEQERGEELKAAILKEEKLRRGEEAARREERAARLSAAEKELSESREREITLRSALENGAFGLREPDAVFEETRALEEECASCRARCEAPRLPVLAIVLLALGAALLALAAAFYPLAAPGAALVIAGVAALAVKLGRNRTAARLGAQREKILSFYRVESEEEFYSLACAHQERWREWKAAAAAVEELSEALSRERLRQSGEGAEPPRSDGALRRELRDSEERLISLRLKMGLLEERLNALPPCGLPGEYDRERHEAVISRIGELESEIPSQRQRADILEGRALSLGDPMVLGTRVLDAKERKARLEAQYAALSLAIETLREANDEMQSRFSPRLGALASEYMSRLTAGRYDRLVFDRSLAAKARLTGDAVDHDLDLLSFGARDQLYLALRLAICTLALPEGCDCPLILDDALVNFDDERMALALDLLEELAATRQIILFTCHEREGKYISAKRGAG